MSTRSGRQLTMAALARALGVSRQRVWQQRQMAVGWCWTCGATRASTRRSPYDGTIEFCERCRVNDRARRRLRYAERIEEAKRESAP